MAVLGVQPESVDQLDLATMLAKRLQLALLPVELESKPGDAGVKLLVTSIGLELAFADTKRGKPYRVDFLTPSWRAKWLAGLGKQHIFRRAIGNQDRPIRLLDGTAGFGQDSILAMTFGCHVTAVEQSPIICALLEDAVGRARRDDDVIGTKLDNLRIVQADTEKYLQGLNATECPDVVYLDPMFEKPKKTAKSPKEMQLLQELMDLEKVDAKQSQEAETRLLEAAMKVALRRVVVKRPLKARAIRPSPTHSYKGQSIRYDVYVNS